jgi:hypothetical protein
MTEFETVAAFRRLVVTAERLDAAGLDRNAIARLRRAGLLVRLFHRVYAVPPVEDTPFRLACRGAVTYGGRGAIVIGESALAFGTSYPAPPAPEIGLPRTRSIRATVGLRVAHCVDPWLVAHRTDGVDVQEPGRAVAWAWSRLARPEDRQAVVCAAVTSGAATTREVRHATSALPPFRRRGDLLGTCDHVDLGCESPAEIAYLTEVERPFGLPPGERQARISVPGGRARRVDVRYGNVVVEIDGRHHRDPGAREADAVRDVVLRAVGLTVVRVDAADVRRSPGLVAALVRETIAQSTAARGPALSGVS